MRLLALAAVAALTAGCARTEAGAPTHLPTTPPTSTPTTVPTTTTTTATPAPTTTTTTEPPTTTTTTTTADAEPAVIEPGEYALTLTGTVAGQDFTRDAQLSVTGTIAEVGTTNGVNALDLCLVAGFPAATPEIGAVWFGSNTGCFPHAGAADIDLAHTTATGATVTVEPDETVAAAGLNTFVDSAGLTACLYFAVAGAMTTTFHPGGAVTGTLDITGDSGPCRPLGTRTDFTATFTGTRL